MLGGILSAAVLSAINTSVESTAGNEPLKMVKFLHGLLLIKNFRDAHAGPSGGAGPHGDAGPSSDAGPSGEGHREDEGGGGRRGRRGGGRGGKGRRGIPQKRVAEEGNARDTQTASRTSKRHRC